MSFDNGPRIVTNGLVLALDAADQNSYVTGSTTWRSLLGTYSGSLVGSASFSVDPNKFNTNCTTITDTGYLSNAPVLTYLDASSYTFDLWVKVDSASTSNTHSLLGRSATSPWLSILSTSVDGSTWNLRFRNVSGVYNTFSTISNANIKNWNNITMTADTNRNLSLYVNGIFRETITTSTSLFYITRIAGGYSSGLNQYNLQGSLAVAKIYNTTLSAIEVQQNYNALKSRFNLT
jgi:hypothetical protein